MSRKTTKRQFKITVNFVSVASFGIPNSNLISFFPGSVAVRNNRLRGGNWDWWTGRSCSNLPLGYCWGGQPKTFRLQPSQECPSEVSELTSSLGKKRWFYPLSSSHLADLKSLTHDVLYETYRTEKLSRTVHADTTQYVDLLHSTSHSYSFPSGIPLFSQKSLRRKACALKKNSYVVRRRRFVLTPCF